MLGAVGRSVANLMDLAGILRWQPDVQALITASYHNLLVIEGLALLFGESSGNPDAYNPGDPSWGLCGVTAPIAYAFGGFSPDDTSWHTDPNKNLKAGLGFLSHLKASWSLKFPDYLWVAGYNEGETQLLHGAKDIGYVIGFQQHLQEIEKS